MATPTTTPNPAEPRSNLARNLGWAAVAVLFAASAWLAVNRIYQVDEAQQVFQSVVQARGEASSFYTYAPLHHLGPMAWVARAAGSAASIFLWDRLLFLLVFWANILLLARICAGSFRLARLLPWLLLAATLVPVWDYGFEVRHDNLLLTGLLGFWLLGREEGRRPWAVCAATGTLAVVLQFIAFKAFLYWLPWTLVLLVFPPPSCRGAGRGRLVLAWACGVLAGLLAVRMAYALGGGWQVVMAGFRSGMATSAAAERFSPMPVLARLASQAPLPVALALAAAGVACRRWRLEGRGYLRWDSGFPELCLLALTLAAFLANPTPFPYNLLFLAPFLLVEGAAFWRTEFPKLPTGALGPVLVSVLVACHILPFCQWTLRHWDHGNDRQVALMDLAEAMTDPGWDAVFDGTGMVPTRPTIGFHWLVHTFTIQAIHSGAQPSVRAMLGEHPAAVIIRNYRSDWLPKEDLQFIQDHYFPLADDFLVLGSVLPSGGGSWTCLHGGRYQVILEQPNRAPGSQGLQVDGQARPATDVLNLTPGPHLFHAPEACRVLVAWLGPKLAALPSLPPGNHLELFVNWY